MKNKWGLLGLLPILFISIWALWYVLNPYKQANLLTALAFAIIFTDILCIVISGFLFFVNSI